MLFIGLMFAIEVYFLACNPHSAFAWACTVGVGVLLLDTIQRRNRR